MKISVKKVILCLILLTSFFKSEIASAQKKDVVAFIPFSNKGAHEKLAEDRLYNLVTTAFINAQRFEILEKNIISVATDWQNYQKNAASINSSIAKQGFIKGAKIIIVGALSNVKATQDDKKNWSAYISVDLKYVNVETGISDFALSLSSDNIPDVPLPGGIVFNKADSPEEAIDKALKGIVPKVEKWIKEKFPLERPLQKFYIDETLNKKGKPVYKYVVLASGGENVGITKKISKMYYVEKECEFDEEKVTLCNYRSSYKLDIYQHGQNTTVLEFANKTLWESLKKKWEETPEVTRKKKFLIVESDGK